MSIFTKGPWVGFFDAGKPVAIMPAMRSGDICTFDKPPAIGDFNIMRSAPELCVALAAMLKIFGRMSKREDYPNDESFTLAVQAIAYASQTLHVALQTPDRPELSEPPPLEEWRELRRREDEIDARRDALIAQVRNQSE